MHANVCIYIYIYIQIMYVCVCRVYDIYIHMYVCSPVYVHILCICIYRSVCVYRCIHMYRFVPVHVDTCERTWACEPYKAARATAISSEALAAAPPPRQAGRSCCWGCRFLQSRYSSPALVVWPKGCSTRGSCGVDCMVYLESLYNYVGV